MRREGVAVTPAEMRASLYREERAAMRASARTRHLVEINSLLRFIAQHDPEAARRVTTQPNNDRYAPSEKPSANMFDSPFRPANYDK